MLWANRTRNQIKHIILILLCACCLVSSSLIADIVDDLGDLDKQPKKTTTPSPNKSKIPSGTNVFDQNPAQKSDKSPTKSKGKSGSNDKGKVDTNERRKLPIHLQSEGTSTYSQNGSLVHLEKNVVITQDDVRIQSDEAKVKLGDKNSDSNVQAVEMKGRVNLNRYSNDPSERITAKGDHAIFDNTSQLVTLEGNARLWRDGHLIRGDKIVYEIETGMVKVDRVQGIVQPDKAKPDTSKEKDASKP